MRPTSNQKVYDWRGNVLTYALRSALQEPERTILSLLKEDLPAMRVLDLGVGAGRTTGHFAPLAKEYLGVDSSPNMIAAARRRFPTLRERLVVGDARSLDDIADASFDFVLFSYNSIDYVGHEDRLVVLREIRRVAREGAYLCFSSHNLRFLPSEFRPRGLSWRRPIHAAQRLYRSLFLRRLNGGDPIDDLAGKDHALIRDTPRLWTYYITPEAQLAQLADHGFADIRVFALQDGRELSTLTDVTDPWLYYLCKVRRVQDGAVEPGAKSKEAAGP